MEHEIAVPINPEAFKMGPNYWSRQAQGDAAFTKVDQIIAIMRRHDEKTEAQG